MTATAADAMLADILANPDDDLPRLVFADWLMEQPDAGSQARGLFIAAEIALVREDVASHEFMIDCREAGFYGTALACSRCKRHHELTKQRDRALRSVQAMADHLGLSGATVSTGAKWLRITCDTEQGATLEVHFDRGFVDAVHCPAGDWLKAGPALVRRHPVRRVEIVGLSPFRMDREPGFNNWCWHGQGVPDSVFEHYLPRYWYASPEEAREALSAGLLTWAREQSP